MLLVAGENQDLMCSFGSGFTLNTPCITATLLSCFKTIYHCQLLIKNICCRCAIGVAYIIDQSVVGELCYW